MMCCARKWPTRWNSIISVTIYGILANVTGLPSLAVQLFNMLYRRGATQPLSGSQLPCSVCFDHQPVVICLPFQRCTLPISAWSFVSGKAVLVIDGSSPKLTQSAAKSLTALLGKPTAAAPRWSKASGVIGIGEYVSRSMGATSSVTLKANPRPFRCRRPDQRRHDDHAGPHRRQ